MLKKSVVIKRKKINISNVNFKNLIFFSLFFSGVIIGVMTIKSQESTLNSLLTDFFNNYIKECENEGFLGCFFDALFIFSLTPFLTFVSGLSAVGLPIIIATPAIMGALTGMTTGFLFLNFSLQGLCYSALIVVPAVSIVIATLIKCCSEAIIMSIDIITCIGGYQNNLKQNIIKEYCLRFLVLFVPIIISAILNVICFKSFGNLFSFVWIFSFYAFNFRRTGSLNITQRIWFRCIFKLLINYVSINLGSVKIFMT